MLLAGGGAFILGLDSLAGRILWAPALLMPLCGAVFCAALACALTDEFLNRSLGLPLPERIPLSLPEFLKPWG